MKQRLASLALGLRRSPLGAVGALSGLTMRESVRKKVFIVLVVFTVVMLGATALLPSIRPEDRVPLIETWAQRAITFFGVLIAVFLAGVSLPDDIEERRVFTLLTKPLARWQLLAGRFAGFASLLAVFALSAFLICSVFVRIVARGATLASRAEVTAREVRVEEEDGLSKVEARSSEADPLIGIVSGGGQTIAFWAFRGVDMDDLPEEVTARCTLEVQGQAMMGFGEMEIFLRPTSHDVPAAEAAAMGWNVRFVTEPKPDAKEGDPPPLRLATRKLIVKHLIPFEIKFPRGWLGETGSLDIAVKRAKPNLTVSVRPKSIVLLSSPHSFEWNFAKAIAFTYLLWMVVLSLTIAGSTVLSAPVNLLFGLSVFITGSMVGYVRESLPTVAERIKVAEAVAEDEHGHKHGGGDDFPVPVLQFSQFVSRVSLAAIPDLNVFDAATPILRGVDIEESKLFEGFKFALVYVVGALLAGLAFFRMREFR
jgi:ABC-type transport system involved in multi-copper enzyme maturation permease subunit